MTEMGKDRGGKLFGAECRFILSAPTPEALPPATYPEVAFIGRSNVGKSSLINALVNRRGLAKTSETPGRTQQLNFFLLADALMLVDMPGYGFARAPKPLVAAWNRLVRNYLRGRPNVRRVLVLIDARRGVGPADHEFMRLLDEAAVSYQAVLTKVDKLTNNALARLEAATREALANHPAAHPEVVVTSAHAHQGLEALRAHLAALAEE